MPGSGGIAPIGKDGASAPAEPELFSRVSVGRISEIIVEQIRLLMRQGQLKPGDRLPPERACASASASARPVREALRMLESAGLVEIRVGARGGAFVTAPSSDRVGEPQPPVWTRASANARPRAHAESPPAPADCSIRSASRTVTRDNAKRSQVPLWRQAVTRLQLTLPHQQAVCSTMISEIRPTLTRLKSCRLSRSGTRILANGRSPTRHPLLALQQPTRNTQLYGKAWMVRPMIARRHSA